MDPTTWFYTLQSRVGAAHLGDLATARPARSEADLRVNLAHRQGAQEAASQVTNSGPWARHSQPATTPACQPSRQASPETATAAATATLDNCHAIAIDYRVGTCGNAAGLECTATCGVTA